MESTTTYRPGDRVLVKHDLGPEVATVISCGPNNPMITVRFDDGTFSSWYRKFVTPIRCEQHPEFEPDNCPRCGTSLRIVRERWES